MMTFATFSGSFADVDFKNLFAAQHLTAPRRLVSLGCMSRQQPTANASQPPSGGADARRLGGAITTTITVTISSVRSVVFA